MYRVRGVSENIRKSSCISEDDSYLSIVRSFYDERRDFKVKKSIKRSGYLIKRREPEASEDDSMRLCDGLFNLIKSTQSIEGSLFKVYSNSKVCGKCKSCYDIQSMEEDRRLTPKKHRSSVMIDRTHNLQSPATTFDNVDRYSHFEFSVNNESQSREQRVDYYKSIDIIDYSDWESDWMYYKRNNKFESYVRRYILHSETPIEQIPDTMFLTGLLCGTLMAQITVLIVVAFYNWWVISSRFSELIIIWRMMRSILFSIIFIFLIAINIYVWQIFGINHVLIFELDPRSHLKYQKIIKIAALLGNIWFCSLINFILFQTKNGYFWMWPYVCVVMTTVWIMNPLPFANYKARRWLLNVIVRIILTPFSQVNFSEFWLADQLNSLSFLFIDLFNGIYLGINFLRLNVDKLSLFLNSSYVGYEQDRTSSISVESQIMVFLVIKIVIIWFRLGQCLRRYHDVRKSFPHLFNAGKYLSSILTIVVTVLKLKNPTSDRIFYLFVIFYIINTIYTYLWDIFMDWNLFLWKNRRIVMREILYRKECYILAAVSNGIIRLYWVSVFFTNDEFVICAGIFLEMVRRFVWNFFRIENEHLNNCGNFRAVREK